MRYRALLLPCPLAALLVLSACRPPASVSSGVSCDGSAARAASHTGTLNVVWGAGTHFYIRTGERTLELLIDRPDRVSSDILQGLSARRIRVDGRELAASGKICADAVTVVEGGLE